MEFSGTKKRVQKRLTKDSAIHPFPCNVYTESYGYLQSTLSELNTKESKVNHQKDSRNQAARQVIAVSRTLASHVFPGLRTSWRGSAMDLPAQPQFALPHLLCPLTNRITWYPPLYSHSLLLYFYKLRKSSFWPSPTNKARSLLPHISLIQTTPKIFASICVFWSGKAMATSA